MPPRLTTPPSPLAEPDSDESLRYLADTIAGYVEPAPVPEDTLAAVIGVLAAFAKRVREHERGALRERPTQPDIGKVLPPNE